jgi:hypothetical protein
MAFIVNVVVLETRLVTMNPGRGDPIVGRDACRLGIPPIKWITSNNFQVKLELGNFTGGKHRILPALQSLSLGQHFSVHGARRSGVGLGWIQQHPDEAK